MADSETSPDDRDSRETEYAGSQRDFGGEVYPRSYPVPGRINLESAMRAYVRGHDRGWDAERKAELTGEEEGYRGPGQAVEEGSPTGPASGELGAGSEPGEAAVGVPGDATPKVGVGVAEELDFRRGPDTWRDRIRAVRPKEWRR